MIPSPFRGTLLAFAAVGVAFSPTAFAQQAPAASDQAVNEVVHSNAQGRHIAPHDTFYTTQYVSARTDKGVDGFPPGTEVRLVSVDRDARTLTVTDGHANVEVTPDKLTNDLDVAAAVKAQDAANQERVARYQQAEAAAYQKYLKDVAEYTAKDLEKRETAIRDANEQRAEQAANSASSNTLPAAALSNGYYNQGGDGYGSPYGYFIDARGLNAGLQNNARPAVTTPNGSNGPGAISSQNGAVQSGNSRTGGATSGTSSSTGSTGSAGAGGGKGRP